MHAYGFCEFNASGPKAVNQVKGKSSYAIAHTGPCHRRATPYHNHKATEPMVELPTHKLGIGLSIERERERDNYVDYVSIYQLDYLLYLSCPRGKR